MTVRPLRKADLDRVSVLERATFADPWSRRSLAESLRQTYVRGLALENAEGLLVAYGLAAVVGPEGEILNLAVEAGCRGQGLGRLLLDGLVAALREEGVTTVFLEVRRSNEPAVALYRSAGFQPQGVRPGYYASPREDALTMALELGSQSA